MSTRLWRQGSPAAGTTQLSVDVLFVRWLGRAASASSVVVRSRRAWPGSVICHFEARLACRGWTRSDRAAGRKAADDDLASGREASTRSEWTDTYTALTRADGSSPLGVEELELLATAAYLVGRVGDCVGALARAYQLHADVGDSRSAVRCAFWLCFHHFNQGEFGQGGGWVAKASRLVEGSPEECAERAYLLLPVAFQQVAVAGEYAGGRATATRAVDIARRCGECDVIPLALNLVGRSLLMEGRVAEGMAALDEAMLEVVTGGVSAPVAGSVYCSLIEACEQIADLRRAQEWTDALSRWCDSQRGMVTFTGQCLVHRATIKQLHGEWVEALEEVRLASRGSCGGRHVRQRCGDVSAGRAAPGARGRRRRGGGVQPGGRAGYDPQPGLALLRLAQRRTDAAAAAIRRAVDECHDRVTRPSCSPHSSRSPWRTVRRSRLAQPRMSSPRPPRCTAHRRWERWRARRSARFCSPRRMRGVHSSPCGNLGGRGGSSMRRMKRRGCGCSWPGRAGRSPTRRRLESSSRQPAGPSSDSAPDPISPAPAPGRAPPAAFYGLTVREVEVLHLVATGMTNQAIADQLYLAVKTVDRHVSNIFTKLGVSSRAAATAFAYQHGLT